MARESSAAACVQAARVRVSSNSRELAMTSPAVDARASSRLSSRLVNEPPRAFVRYRLPKTSPPMRMGAPRKDCIAG